MCPSQDPCDGSYAQVPIFRSLPVEPAAPRALEKHLLLGPLGTREASQGDRGDKTGSTQNIYVHRKGGDFPIKPHQHRMHPIILAVRLFLKQDRCRRSASDWPGDAPWVLGLTPLERVPCRPQTRPSVIRTVQWASFKYPLPHLLALEDSTAVQVADRGGWMLGHGRSTRLDTLGSRSLPSCSGDRYHAGLSVIPAPSLGTRPRVRQPVLSARVATPSPLAKEELSCQVFPLITKSSHPRSHSL